METIEFITFRFFIFFRTCFASSLFWRKEWALQPTNATSPKDHPQGQISANPGPRGGDENQRSPRNDSETQGPRTDAQTKLLKGGCAALWAQRTREADARRDQERNIGDPNVLGQMRKSKLAAAKVADARAPGQLRNLGTR